MVKHMQTKLVTERQKLKLQSIHFGDTMKNWPLHAIVNATSMGNYFTQLKKRALWTFLIPK